MSKNITFFILMLTAAILTYILNPSLAAVVELVTSERLPRDFVRMMRQSDLVAFAGAAGLFGVLFLLVYLVFPVTYVWYHIRSARRIVGELPLAHNPAKRTDKKKFLDRLQGLGFIYELAEKYSPYLIQEPEQEVKAEALKSVRILKKGPARNKEDKIVIAPVRATAPAEVIFNRDNLVRANLILDFFTVFARLLIGAGVIFLGLSLVDYSLLPERQNIDLLTALQPGMTALLICLIAGLLVAGGSRSAMMILTQNVKSLAFEINVLFHQNDWQQDMAAMAESLSGDALFAQFKGVLQKSLEPPMAEISSAVKALAVEQEKKLDGLLSNTLAYFTRDIEQRSAAEAKALNEALKSAADTADQMQKQFSEANTLFSKQMTKQSTAIARHLTDMQKALDSGEKKNRKEMDKMISSLVDEVEAAYKNFGGFVESNLKSLETKQAALDTAVSDRESILKDLHSSAKDLGTISNASARLLEKFNALASEMDVVLTRIQESGIHGANGDAEKRDKLKLALLNLKKATSDKTRELPDM